MKDLNIVFAGFGGQGVLFAGKVAAYAGLLSGKELSWLPSYGPEMRGGTANCSVCISDAPIGSPLVTAPNVLVAMNLPSLDKFIDAVEPGGVVLFDSTLIARKIDRTDVTVYPLPATALSESEGLRGLSNMILTGKLFSAVCCGEGPCAFCDWETLYAALKKCVPAKRAEMLSLNQKAIELGASL